MKNLDDDEKQFLIERLQKGEDIPIDFKYKIFPTKEKEYNLAYQGKMRKEDLLADEDGTFPAPLQIEASFSGEQDEPFEDGWKNMIVFGDNLSFLKNINENKDPLIKDKVKGKVKLIYIDPPFATADEFQNNEGVRAYSDKKKGAEFVEFLRRRLIVAREILADDGSIYVHLDQKMSHYIKIVMDEIFGKENFNNEIVWSYTKMGGATKNYNANFESLLFYSKTQNYNFNFQTKDIPSIFHNRHKNKIRDNKLYYKDIKGTKDTLIHSKIKQAEKRYGRELKDDDIVLDFDLKENKQKIDNVWRDIPALNNNTSEKEFYPTQKPVALLARIIKASSNEGDIVLDFFGGSGTTMTVAEQLGRKWITCDFGKLAYFTMQKRILRIYNSKKVENSNEEYGKNSKNFITAKNGFYDFEKVMSLEWSKYQEFVSRLFNLNIKKNIISGIEFEAKKRNEPVKIFDYRKFPNSTIDEDYLQGLHDAIGTKISGRVYIVAPANSIDFVDDYHDIGSIKYYFLKIPYHFIEDLHSQPFRKLRQPKSKKYVNELDNDNIGFHFIFSPEVKSYIRKDDENVKIIIESFTSKEIIANRTSDEREMGNFELLSAVFIDKNYNGKNFEMDDALFFDKLKKNEDGYLEINFKKSELGNKIMIIYTDIFGNDSTKSFSI